LKMGKANLVKGRGGNNVPADVRRKARERSKRGKGEKNMEWEEGAVGECGKKWIWRGDSRS